MKQCAEAAGFGYWTAQAAGQRVETGDVERLVNECSELLSQAAIVQALTNAVELHQHLTDQIRGDIADLYDESGELLPVKDWPHWARTGGVQGLDVEPVMAPSKDGGGRSWDDTGKKKTKLRLAPRFDREKLLAQLKSVDALAAQKQDINLNVQLQVEEKLRGALERFNQVEQVIDVTPQDVVTSGDNDASTHAQVSQVVESKEQGNTTKC